ncbi:MAG: c-type cytochrome biogenesis protein CcsB [Desulfohalobiaceae bacterium]|nr:c-type cytochrome biogenesis protein CcsB [Desulfohalobiaceae bacterium]
MNSSYLLSIVTFVYALAAFFYLAAWIFHKKSLAVPARWVTVAAVLGNTAGIIWRWLESYQLGIGHAPFSNLYESMVFFAWTIGVLYLWLEFRYKMRIVGAFALTLAFLSLAYASLSPGVNSQISPLIPALKSNWLMAHVVTCFFGYAAFAVAFCISLMYLLKLRDQGESSPLLKVLPGLRTLDELTYQMVVFGFLFLSVGIVTGAVWANSAWGTYWSWDPKETWSLITWLIYAALIHARMMRGWQGKRIAFVSILGFCAVIFTYFGVNYLPGLHSYA